MNFNHSCVCVCADKEFFMYGGGLVLQTHMATTVSHPDLHNKKVNDSVAWSKAIVFDDPTTGGNPSETCYLLCFKPPG